VSVNYGAGRQIPFKFEVNPAGVVVYHNTTIGAQVDARFWSNGHFRNNLFVGPGDPKGVALQTMTHTAHSTMDYDGWSAGRFNFQGPQTEMKWRSFPGLAEFAKATGLERHGRIVDFGIFRNPPERPFDKKETVKPNALDLRLEPGSAAVDAGCVLPNVNDDFNGKAPDLGALEIGKPLPHYGPRENEAEAP